LNNITAEITEEVRFVQERSGSVTTTTWEDIVATRGARERAFWATFDVDVLVFVVAHGVGVERPRGISYGTKERLGEERRGEEALSNERGRHWDCRR